MGKRNEAFVKGDTVKIMNAECKYAWLFEPDTKYAPIWSITVKLTEEQAKAMTDVGFNVKFDADGVGWLKAKRVVTTRKGEKLGPPKVVGLDPRVPFTEPVGDGSICNVKIWAKYVTVNGNEFLTAGLEAVQVVDHKEKADADFDDLSGSGGTSVGEDDLPF